VHRGFLLAPERAVVNTAEWRQELQRLRYIPGHDAVHVVYWRGWLDKNRTTPMGRMSMPPMVVRRMSVKERWEMNENRQMRKGHAEASHRTQLVARHRA
jgi:hypothetical protein